MMVEGLCPRCGEGVDIEVAAELAGDGRATARCDHCRSEHKISAFALAKAKAEATAKRRVMQLAEAPRPWLLSRIWRQAVRWHRAGEFALHRNEREKEEATAERRRREVELAAGPDWILLDILKAQRETMRHVRSIHFTLSAVVAVVVLAWIGTCTYREMYPPTPTLNPYLFGR